MLEHLETRCLFAIPVTGGVLQINGSDGANALELVLNGTTIQLRNANTLAVVDSIAAAGVTGANVNMLGGNDLFRVGRPDGTMMPNITVTLRGGNGDDSLTGGIKADSIQGEAGNDLIDGRALGDSIDGGVGFDTADYGYRANQVKVNLSDTAANDGTNAGNNSTPAQYNDNGADKLTTIEAVVAGSGNDSLVGSANGEWFDGGAGNDSIYCGNGTDTANGGTGADLIYGEGGDDYFFIQDNIGDKFLGGPGTTFAQYDISSDLAAPALPVSPVSAAALTASFVPIASAFALPSLVPNSSPISSDDDLNPDNDFGTGGKTLTEVDGRFIQINDMKVQQFFDGDELIDEKFVVVGTIDGDSDSDFVIIRYNNDGTLDSTFGEAGTGIVTADFSDEYNNVEDDETVTDDTGNSLVIDSNGNIVVAGTVDPVEDNSLIGVVRYDAEGFIDSTFGDEGFLLINVNDSNNDQTATRIATQQVFNGDTTVEEYVIAGTIVSSAANQSDFLLTRIFENGSTDFDLGFAGGEGSGPGYVTLDYFHNKDFATGLAIDPLTQNIWVSGYTQNVHTTNFLIAGYDAGGLPIDGALTNYDFGADDYAYASVISGDKLFVVGSTGFGESVTGAILAVNISEDSYYYPGQVTNNYYLYNGNGPVSLHGVTVDTEGNLVAVGSVDDDDFFVHRFDYNLNPIGNDTIVDFASDGFTPDIASAVGIQDDGKIVVAGTSNGSAAITRLTDFHLVDVEINALTFNFIYTDETGSHPLPTYLTSKLTSLGLGGVVNIPGTPGDDKFTAIIEGDPLVTITLTNANGIQVFTYDSSQVTLVVLSGLDGNDSILCDPLFWIPTILDGGKGNDSIRGGSANDSIRGGDGNDSIEAGIGNDTTFGDAGNDSIKGGDDNDLVLGGNGNDCLQGNNGRDILIGGGDTDRLDGGAGDDIETGGSTNFDSNIAALNALMAEWARTDADYNTRSNHITGATGGGLNGTFKLNASTVHSSGFLPDSLTGGADKDLFFVASFGDKILDLDKKNEKTILVHA